MNRKFIILMLCLVVMALQSDQTEQLDCQNDLSLGYGYIYNLSTQDVNPDNDILFDSNGILHNISHVRGSSNIILNNSGIYIINFLTQGIFANSFVLFVNNKPVPGGSYEPVTDIIDRNDKEYGQIIINARVGDIVTLRNYSPANNKQTAYLKAAGKAGMPLSVNASLVIFQIR